MFIDKLGGAEGVPAPGIHRQPKDNFLLATLQHLVVSDRIQSLSVGDSRSKQKRNFS